MRDGGFSPAFSGGELPLVSEGEVRRTQRELWGGPSPPRAGEQGATFVVRGGNCPAEGGEFRPLHESRRFEGEGDPEGVYARPGVHSARDREVKPPRHIAIRSAASGPGPPRGFARGWFRLLRLPGAARPCRRPAAAFPLPRAEWVRTGVRLVVRRPCAGRP